MPREVADATKTSKGAALRAENAELRKCLERAERSVLQMAGDLARQHVENVRLQEQWNELFDDWRHLIEGMLQDTRVSYADAIAGRPDLKLPPTPARTLRRWKNHHARMLGVEKKSDAAGQQFLVSGLRALHANPRRGTVPPQSAAEVCPATSGRVSATPSQRPRSRVRGAS